MISLVDAIPAIGIVAGAVATGFFLRWVAKIQGKQSPYAVLAERVVALEKADDAKGKEIVRLRNALELLRNDFSILVPELIRLDKWIKGGAAPPPPILSVAAQDILQRHHPPRMFVKNDNGDYVLDESA